MGSEASSQAELDRLAEEFVDRTRRGEGPTISSYVREHPDLADDINRLFPLLQALEHVEPEAPTQLGDYRIVREVGRGGMGVVYEAVQEPLGRRVALKILPKHMTLDARLLDRFRLEAQAAARLQHRHIVPVIGWGQHEGVYYYTMQFVDGAGLDAVDELPGEGTHYERAARAVLQASEGVAAAHARGVLHRDIKPSNLMLDEKGAVWVTDFGLCKEVESEGVTQPHDLLGTLRYMAPERFKGVSDVQGDVYGLGLTLYELLTREPAYQGEDHAALAARIAESGPPRPRKLDPHIPPDLELIVLKAIHRDRAQRYATVDALAADLRAYLDRRPVTARAPTVGYLLRSFVRRHKAITAIGCAAIVAIVLSTTFYVVSLRDKESTARFRQYIANVAAAETALRDRDVPVAERLLAEAPSEFRNWEWRHLSSQLDRSTRSFPRWRWNVSYVAYAPSGHWVASVAAGQTRMVDADSGETEAEIEHRSHVQDMAWHPTGLFWAVGTPMGVEVWSWPEPQRIIDEPVGDVRAIAFSKDGTQFAYGGRNGVVHVVDAVTRAELFTQDLETPIDALAFEATGRKLAVGTYDANVVVFDLTTGTRAWDARVGREAITSLRFTGQVLAVPSSDGHVELRSAVDGALVHVLGHDHPSRRAQVAVTRNGGRLLTTDGPYVHVWDPIEGRRLLTYGNDSVTTCAAFDAEGERIVTGSRRGTVLEWRVPARHDPDLWRGTSEQFDAFEYAPDGRIYVAGGVLLRVFDGTTHQEVRNWFGHRSSVHTIRFSADGAYAASGDYAGEVLIWDVAEDRLLHRIQAVRNEGYRAARVAFAADGTVLFTGGTDGVLRKWSVATGELVAEQVVYEGWLSSLVAHEDGDLLVVGDHDGLIRLFDPATLRVQRELAGHKGIATDLAFLPGTRRLVSASWDRTVRIWDTETGETVRTFRALTADSAGMADAYLAVTFLPDATRIAAGSADGSAKLWDVGSGRLVATLRGGQGWMRGARFSPDGERLVTVEGRGIIRRWETRPFRDRLDAIDARADLIRKAEDALVALQTTDADPDAVIEAARAQTGMGPDAHRALIDAAYRARSTPDGLITRAWALFLSRDRARADYDGMLAILDTMRTDAENPRARDPELTTVRMLGAFRRGDARRVVNARGIGDAEGEPTALHAVELAVRSLAHKRLDDAAESKQRLAELEALLREHPALLEARGVRALTAEARKAQR